MSDQMRPLSFQQLLKGLLDEYKASKCFMSVPVVRHQEENYKSAIGPAAGPHTQLAGNIVAAYGAGASHFELKTVQILEGAALGVLKPCILSYQEVYNTEWSTELTVQEALGEYVKAYLLLKLLIIEFGLGDVNGFEFIMSVGYDLAGIKSQKIDSFIENMKWAEATEEWQEDVAYVLAHLDLFEHVTEGDVKALSPVISETIALSTLHGCKSEEIETIAIYLIEQKKLNTYIKMNPTLLGKEAVRDILDQGGYEQIIFDEGIFQMDIDFLSAVLLIKKVQHIAKEKGKIFGVKLTNTFPVKIMGEALQGESMYMSGPPLYPIAIGVAALLQEAFQGELSISYSGGADLNNIEDILNTGIYPVTVSSVLLKPGGYKNITKMNAKVDDMERTIQEAGDGSLLKDLAHKARTQKAYYQKPVKVFKRLTEYSALCAKCNNCVDVCPNRANERMVVEDKTYVIHYDQLCNECGNCRCFCIAGHDPCYEKWTLFESRDAFEGSQNDGLFSIGEDIICRINGQLHHKVPHELKTLAQSARYGTKN